MSDETVSMLNSELSRVRQELVNVAAEAKRRKLDYRKLAAEKEVLQKEHESVMAEYKALKERSEAAPSELEKELAGLKAQLKVRDVRDKFRSIESQLGEKVTLDKLFKYNDFDPSTADLESLDVDSLAKAWKEESPGLFKSEVSTTNGAAVAVKRPELRTETPAGRGYPDEASNKLYVKRSGPGSYSDPAWMQKNQARVAAAAADNNLVLID